MESKRFQIFALMLLFFSPSMLLSIDSNLQKKIIKNRVGELRGKYGSFRPKEVLFLKDTMSSSERIDLDNEYFKISYPKCFTVEPTLGPEDGITIKNSAALDLVRTKKCAGYENELELNTMQLFYESHFVDPELIENVEVASKAFYRQMIDVDGLTGVVYMGIGTSSSEPDQGEFVSGWSAVLGCEGKKKELFRFTFATVRKEKVVEMLEKKTFLIPEDIKKIVSSFRCRKDR